MTIDGTDAPFLLDTGAERSMLFLAAAERLHVARDQWVSTATRGVGGIVDLPNADPRTLTLAGLALRRRTLAADHTLVVGAATAGPADGLLGQDFLSAYTIEIDGPADTLRLYTPDACVDPAAVAIPARRVFRSVLLIPVSIDGHVLQAEIDSGASTTIITAPGMGKLGLLGETPAPGHTVRGIGRGSVPIGLHRFARVTIGDQTFTDQQIWGGPVHLAASVDMLLGADWLRTRRVILSFAAGTVAVLPAAKPGG